MVEWFGASFYRDYDGMMVHLNLALATLLNLLKVIIDNLPCLIAVLAVQTLCAAGSCDSCEIDVNSSSRGQQGFPMTGINIFNSTFFVTHYILRKFEQNF